MTPEQLISHRVPPKNRWRRRIQHSAGEDRPVISGNRDTPLELTMVFEPLSEVSPEVIKPTKSLALLPERGNIIEFPQQRAPQALPPLLDILAAGG